MVMDQPENEGRILVIDDELGMREGCRRALAPLGYAVDVAADVASGLDLLARQAYDLFLLDVMLPDGSGLDLLAPILERDPLAVCIVITGYGNIEVAVEAIRRGAYDFLSKPFTSDELIVAVNQGLERRRLKIVEARAEALAQEKEELERLDQAKSQFMLTVAHELRAPIAAVQSYVKLIQAGYVSQEELASILGRVDERLRQSLDLIADLLELARLRQAGDALRREASPQPMAQILEKVADFFRPQAREKGQLFDIQIRDCPTIRADAEHLEQIWTNLISNAIKYTPRGGRILVTLSTSGDEAVGSVQDTGIGIAPEGREHLFQEFFRTDEAKASGEIGTGLGLSIVKEIVDAYRGEIKVASRPGEGTCFTFRLPLAPPAAGRG